MSYRLASLENLRDANIVLAEFLKLRTAEDIPVDTPLINFVKFLLQTLEV